MKPNSLERLKLSIVRTYTSFLNALLRLIERILFVPPPSAPHHILIFKSGNIGDIVCAIPLFIAIRRTYPNARITLWTSPGKRDIPGAVELLSGAWYLDEIRVYDSSDINSLKKIFRFGARMRKERYDLFIHVPVHDWMAFRTFVRNMVFIRLVGFRSAFGFRVRTIIRLFRKTQIDYTTGMKESESLLKLFSESGIRADRVEFDFPVFPAAKKHVTEFLRSKWPDYERWASGGGLLVAIHDGSKRKEKQWPPERFGEVAHYIEKTYGTRFVILGGADDLEGARIIQGHLSSENVLMAAGKLNIIEIVALIKKISFLVCVDSGPMHIAGALGKPTVGLFSVLSIIGKWYPHGDNHEALFHRFLNCNYHTPGCVRESMGAITVPEVEAACDRMIGRIKSGN